MRPSRLLKIGVVEVVVAGLFFALALLPFRSQAQQTINEDKQQLSWSVDSSGSNWTNSARDLHAPARDKVLRLGKRIRHTRLDCSHLVHQLYQRAGLAYEYVNSEQLYDGMPGFRQVEEPVAGDIVVWRGHMGVVVDPLLHSFLSGLRTGVRVAAYDSNYWKGRGIPRFFRYTGGDDVVDLSRQVRVARNHILPRAPLNGE
jgi:hypothetical protein